MTTWILCPNLRGARLFRIDSLDEGVSFVRELRRPNKQLREEDFATEEDVPEMTQDPTLYQAEIEVAETFATYLARFLDESLRDRHFDRLIVCAEAQLLGIIRRRFSIEVEERILGTIGIDLYNVNESDLVNYVKDFLLKSEAA